MVELADTQDLGSCAERHAGSSPVRRTSGNRVIRRDSRNEICPCGQVKCALRVKYAAHVKCSLRERGQISFHREAKPNDFTEGASLRFHRGECRDFTVRIDLNTAKSVLADMSLDFAVEIFDRSCLRSDPEDVGRLFGYGKRNDGVRTVFLLSRISYRGAIRYKVRSKGPHCHPCRETARIGNTGDSADTGKQRFRRYRENSALLFSGYSV